MDQGIPISSLAYTIYIRWWDRFTRPLVMPTKATLFQEPVPPLIIPPPVLPPALSPDISSWVLQIQKDKPEIAIEEALRLAHMLQKYGAKPPEASHANTKEAIVPKETEPLVSIPETTGDFSIMSPFAQSPWSLKDLHCTICGNTGHQALLCPEAPYNEFDFDLGPHCYCCGQYGHVTIRCPARCTPTEVVSTEESSTQHPVAPSLQLWQTVDAGPSTTVPIRKQSPQTVLSPKKSESEN